MSDGWLRDHPVRPASSDHRREPYLQRSAPEESHGPGLPCGAQGSYLRIERLAGAGRHTPAESRSVWTGRLSVVVPCGDHGARVVPLPSWRSSLRHRRRLVLCRPLESFGLTRQTSATASEGATGCLWKYFSHVKGRKQAG